MEQCYTQEPHEVKFIWSYTKPVNAVTPLHTNGHNSKKANHSFLKVKSFVILNSK